MEFKNVYALENRLHRLFNGVRNIVCDVRSDADDFDNYLLKISNLRKVAVNFGDAELVAALDYAKEAVETRLDFNSNVYDLRRKAVAKIDSAAVIINKRMWV